MKYKKSLMTVMAVAMLGLSGCAENQIPEMTEEEVEMVIESCNGYMGLKP